MLALLALIAACKGDKLEPESGLMGTWKLKSYCKPEGTNTCTNITIPANKGVFIEFSVKGTFKEYYQNTIPVEHAFLGCGNGSYEIENNDVRIKAMCMSSLAGRLIKIKSLTNKKLVIVPFDTGEYIFERE